MSRRDDSPTVGRRSLEGAPTPGKPGRGEDSPTVGRRSLEGAPTPEKRKD
jgi:hypothetical protein